MTSALVDHAIVFLYLHFYPKGDLPGKSFQNFSRGSRQRNEVRQLFDNVTLRVYKKIRRTRSYPRGVLRYISDGDVRSPFLGLKFAI